MSNQQPAQRPTPLTTHEYVTLMEALRSVVQPEYVIKESTLTDVELLWYKLASKDVHTTVHDFEEAMRHTDTLTEYVEYVRALTEPTAPAE